MRLELNRENKIIHCPTSHVRLAITLNLKRDGGSGFSVALPNLIFFSRRCCIKVVFYKK